MFSVGCKIFYIPVLYGGNTMKIIDAHMHPFTNIGENIKWYNKEENSDFLLVRKDMERAGITKFCGSVITAGGNQEEKLINSNEKALLCYRENSDVYVPGVVIHPEFIEKSCEYIKKAHDMGLRLIGELTPYIYGWSSYMSAAEIFEYAASLDMTVSCHPTNMEDMKKLAETFPHMDIVYAHPGEKQILDNNIELLVKYENVYLDISGTGVQRYGAIKELINRAGKEKILFGTDYSVCNPATYVAAMMYENISDDEREYVFYKNAERVFKL